MSKKSSVELKRKQQQKERDKQRKIFDKYVRGLIRDQKRERDRLLISTMKRASKVGVYNPKEFKLTKYRRTKANKVLKEFGELLDPTKFFFVPAPKKVRKKAFNRADSLSIKHSKTGLFVPKEGHKAAKIKVDKKRDEVYIERTGKTKRGPTKGVRYKTITPLASIDELDNERERIRQLAKQLGPLGPNDRITFKIVENGLEGYSHSIFSNVELLLKYLEHYRKTIPARINFFRHIQLEKTTSSQWFAEHPTTMAGRKGRKARDAIRQNIKVKNEKKASRIRL